MIPGDFRSRPKTTLLSPFGSKITPLMHLLIKKIIFFIKIL